MMNAGLLRSILPSKSVDTPISDWTWHIRVLVAAWVVALALHWRDAADMTAIWWNSSTFNHCLFIPFIIGWLVSQRREEVSRITPQIWLPGVAFICIASLVWMVGAAGSIGLLRHAGLILTLQALVLSLLGPNITRALLFPLFYMCFMVPAGEELVPLLQTITAEICMFFLGVFGIPAHISGIFITIPNGYFEVAEACSGVKFLVAMVAYGALVCNVCFTSWKRRAAFMALAIVVPVLANGIRAFATIYIAHKTNVESAAGFDHVFYGWFFFAIVMIAIMVIGWRFFDRKPSDAWLPNFVTWPSRAPASNTKAIGLSAFAIAVPALWLATFGSAGRDPLRYQIILPDVAGWSRVKAIEPSWDAHFAGADHRLIGHYRNAKGMTVDVSVALYAWQDEGRELVGFGQGAAGLEGRWTWAASKPAPPGAKADQLMTAGPISREVVTYYVTHAGMTGSASDVKLAALKAKLLGRDQAAGAILISAIDLPGTPGRVAINAFLKDVGSPQDAVNRLIKQARGR